MASKKVVVRRAYGLHFYPQVERYRSCRKALENAILSVSTEYDWADVWVERGDLCVLIFEKNEVQAKADEENEKRGIRVLRFNVHVGADTSSGSMGFRTHIERVG